MINYAHTAECTLPLTPPSSENTPNTHANKCKCNGDTLCAGLVSGPLVGDPGFWPLAPGSGSRRPASWTFPSQRPQGPPLLTHTHLRSPPSFKLYLIFSCCGWSGGLWVRRSCSHSFLPNRRSNGEVYAGNLSSHWVMSCPLLSTMCSFM